MSTQGKVGNESTTGVDPTSGVQSPEERKETPEEVIEEEELTAVNKGIETEVFGKWSAILRNLLGALAVFTVCLGALANAWTTNVSVTQKGEWPSEVSMIVKLYNPDTAICEDNFMGMSPLTFKQLIQCVGMLRETFTEHGVHLSYVLPLLAKEIVGANFKGTTKQDVKDGLLEYTWLDPNGLDLSLMDEHTVDAGAVTLFRCESIAKQYGVDPPCQPKERWETRAQQALIRHQESKALKKEKKRLKKLLKKKS